MTEFDAILEDIRTNPADDLPRLALADWLMEQDDPDARSRGEFIHARCRAASLPPRDPERAALQHRAEELREGHEIVWLGGLAEYLDSWDFERGMIVAGVSSRFALSGPVKRLATAPGWKWVIGLRGLDLSSAAVAILVTRRILSTVTSLDLRDCEVREQGASGFSQSAHLSRLVALDLGYTRLGSEGFLDLLESPRLPALRTLLVDSNGISADGVKALAESPDLPRLECLDLSRNPIEDKGVIALAKSPHHACLRELRLASCGIRNRSGIALATSTTLANITLLDLRDNPLDEATRTELRDRFGERVLLESDDEN